MPAERGAASKASGPPRRADGRGSRARARPKGARVPAVLALVAVLLALVLGIVIGYSAAGDPPPAGLVTEERPVPVVTVTVPEDPSR